MKAVLFLKTRLEVKTVFEEIQAFSELDFSINGEQFFHVHEYLA
jgi:hypothetical protein